MTPEQELAKALGSLPTTQMEKMAAAFSEMSIEELEELLAKETGGVVKTAAIEKVSAEEKLALADNWGRELARQHVEQMSKEAAKEEKKDLKEGLGRVGMLAGGAIGAHGSYKKALRHGLKGGKRGMEAAAGGLLGATVGAGAGQLAHAAAKRLAPKEKTSAAQRLEAVLEKTALPTGALTGLGGKLMGAGKAVMQNPGVKKTIGQGAKAISGAGIGKTLAIGAGGGAAMGALQQPQPGGSRIGGALRGAAMGAGIAGGASAGIKALGKAQGTAGGYLRGAMKAAK